MSERSAKTSSKSPRNRPPSERRARKALAIRKRLIEAALRGFERNGFTRTTIDTITEAADLGKGTFYNYFDSKEALLAEWGAGILVEAGRALAEPREGEPALRLLFRMFSELLGVIEKRPKLAAPLVMAHLLLPDHPPAQTGEKRVTGKDDPKPPLTLHEVVQPVVERAVSEDALRSDMSPDRLTSLIVAQFYETVMETAVQPDGVSPGERLKKALVLALEGASPAE